MCAFVFVVVVVFVFVLFAFVCCLFLMWQMLCRIDEALLEQQYVRETKTDKQASRHRNVDKIVWTHENTGRK